MRKFTLEQPKGFEDPHNPNGVYKLRKAFNGLKQAPCAWYDMLSSHLLTHGYIRGLVDNTLFVNKVKSYVVIAQVYADDIVVSSTSDSLVKQFIDMMTSEFEMSLVGELDNFLGLQVKQKKRMTFSSLKPSMPII
ncbi:hypothetical protein ACFX2J_013128 [Malus domestica]